LETGAFDRSRRLRMVEPSLVVKGGWSWRARISTGD